MPASANMYQCSKESDTLYPHVVTQPSCELHLLGAIHVPSSVFKNEFLFVSGCGRPQGKQGLTEVKKGGFSWAGEKGLSCVRGAQVFKGRRPLGGRRNPGDFECRNEGHKSPRSIFAFCSRDEPAAVTVPKVNTPEI